ncbi:hypothetical protein FSB65_38960 [Paraburkholderia sp. JPY418]|nr:hypothetical protein [Paraburkholderia youngii]
MASFATHRRLVSRLSAEAAVAVVFVRCSPAPQACSRHRTKRHTPRCNTSLHMPKCCSSMVARSRWPAMVQAETSLQS